MVARGGGYARFKKLHPDGGILKLLKNVVVSLVSGKKELATYIGNVLHVVMDFLTSVVAAGNGLVIALTGDGIYDEYAGVLIMWSLVAFALITLVFAYRHGDNDPHHKGCHHH